MIYNMEQRLRFTGENHGRRLVQKRGTRHNTVYKKRAIKGMLCGKVLFDNRYVAERAVDGFGTHEELRADNPEELAEKIVKNDKSRDGKAPDYNFQFDVWTNPESTDPRYRLDESESIRFLDAVSKARKR